MSISDRFRDIMSDVQSCNERLRLSPQSAEYKGLRFVAKAAAELREVGEGVGEIPRIKLESQLTPVLLKVHADLDRARLLYEEEGEEDTGAGIWDLEQKIYRLLNDL